MDTGGGRLSWPSILREARCVSNGTKRSLMEQKVASTVLLPRVSLWAQDTALPLRRKDAATAVSWLLGPGFSSQEFSSLLPILLVFGTSQNNISKQPRIKYTMYVIRSTVFNFHLEKDLKWYPYTLCCFLEHPC